jgi:hypothetical protein
VAKTEDDISNLDDLGSLDDLTAPVEGLDAMGEAAADAATVPAEEKPAEAKDEKAKKPAAADDDELAPEKQPPYLAIVLGVGVVVVLLALGYFKILSYAMAICIVGVALVLLMIWMGRKTNTVYTVLLGCVLIALMVSVYCLWHIYHDRYNSDIKAQEAKQRVSMMQPADRDMMRC